MNKNIFAVLILMLRFDNPNDRDGRGKSECAAPVSQVFKKFVSNCRAVYTIGSCACDKQMLVSSHGQCKLKVFMSCKPVKYGTTFMCITDTRNCYFPSGYICTDKGSDQGQIKG